MAIRNPNLDEEIIAYDKLQTDELNRFQGGDVTMDTTGETVVSGGITWHQHKVDIIFGRAFTSPPVVNAIVNSPSSWGFSAPTFTGRSLTGVSIYCWRINANPISLSWSASPIS